ncbi:histone-lysine N-methyltransferase SETMAR-like [Penaeus monodon]|uniref:histone-lysine N-methyltransferase SETMAR-like n=1 Tax=Penaeus monodon TaxID=6687 RepID=UPI0018A7DBB1|nr:histone-lysine N-methyltransferase SETMAR-like [Penaeus monodon]
METVILEDRCITARQLAQDIKTGVESGIVTPLAGKVMLTILWDHHAMEVWFCRYDIFSHPPYSPDTAPSEFHLFPSMKSFLKCKRFQDDENLISEITSWLQTQPADFYKRGGHRCIKR